MDAVQASTMNLAQTDEAIKAAQRALENAKGDLNVLLHRRAWLVSTLRVGDVVENVDKRGAVIGKHRISRVFPTSIGQPKFMGTTIKKDGTDSKRPAAVIWVREGGELRKVSDH